MDKHFTHFHNHSQVCFMDTTFIAIQMRERERWVMCVYGLLLSLHFMWLVCVRVIDTRMLSQVFYYSLLILLSTMFASQIST
jgi:hypothetical protein